MVKSYNFATSFNGLIYYRYTLLQNGKQYAFRFDFTFCRLMSVFYIGFMSESKFPNLMI